MKYIQFHTPGIHCDFKQSEMEILLYHSNYDDEELLDQHVYDKSKKNFMIKQLNKKINIHMFQIHNTKRDRINGVIIHFINFEKLNHRQSETLGSFQSIYKSIIKHNKILVKWN